jgi:hypothetical protein
MYTFDLLTWRVMINGLNPFEDKVLFPGLLVCHVQRLSVIDNLKLNAESFAKSKAEHRGKSGCRQRTTRFDI